MKFKPDPGIKFDCFDSINLVNLCRGKLRQETYEGIPKGGKCEKNETCSP